MPTLANILAVNVFKLGDWRVHNLNLVALYDQLSTARPWPLTDVKDSISVLKFSDHNCYEMLLSTMFLQKSPVSSILGWTLGML